jgi:hypothetical protein
MNLHEDKKLFSQAIRATAQQLGIAEIYIEKDYWVTLALHLIFKDKIGKETVFKGGTALSKCYGLIERFSEDIDLVVIQNDNVGSQLKKKLKAITSKVAEKLEETELEGITNKMGVIRKVAFNYPKTATGVFGQVRDKIIVEATWLGRHEPYSQKEISSYIYQMMKSSGQKAVAEKFDLQPFSVNVLSEKRTICEKIMSLVRFSYGENPIENLKNKIRHTYDIHQLLKVPEIEAFFLSEDFDEMLTLVGEDDVASFKSKNEWLFIHPKEAKIFSTLDSTWSAIEPTYSNNFKNLVYGVLPGANEVKFSLKKVSERLQNIEWKVKAK